MNNKNLVELKKRDLDKCYLSIYCISQEIYVNLGDGKIDKQIVYLFYGCNLLGQRRYISYTSSIYHTSEWYDFFQCFKNRCLENIFYAVIPDIKAMKDALKLSFPNIEVLPSIFDGISKVMKYFASHDKTTLLMAIKNVFLADDISQYQIYRDNFNELFSSPFTLDLISPFLDKAKSVYYLPLHMRKAIFAFYFLRDNIKKLNVISHSKNHFDNVEDFISSCVPVFQSFELKTYCPKNTWLIVLNTLYDSKKDLLKSYL